jgi:uncharacterized membrane protein
MPTTVEETVDIRAPIDAVFAALTDPRRVMEWNSQVLTVRAISSETPRPGTTWQQEMDVMGQRMTVTCRVTHYAPPFEADVDVSGAQRGRIWTRCRPGNGATSVTEGIEVELPGGPFSRMAGQLVKGPLRRELLQTMQRQREILERESGGVRGSGTS